MENIKEFRVLEVLDTIKNKMIEELSEVLVDTMNDVIETMTDCLFDKVMKFEAAVDYTLSTQKPELHPTLKMKLITLQPLFMIYVDALNYWNNIH